MHFCLNLDSLDSRIKGFFKANQANPLILQIMVQTNALAIAAGTGRVIKALCSMSG
jgi:hypothetical protein